MKGVLIIGAGSGFSGTGLASLLAQRSTGRVVEVRNRKDDALGVIALTPHIREYLTKNDPKALEQVEAARKPFYPFA